MIAFFTAQALEFFQQRLVSKPKATGGASDEQDKEKIRQEINEPSNEWARLVTEELPEYTYKPDNRVLGQFAMLKKYTWAKLYLHELGDQGIYFRVGVAEGGGELTYNIDCFWKKLSSEEQDLLWETIKQSGAEDQPVFPDDFPNYDWSRLVGETVSFIKKYEPLFRHLHTLLNANMEAAQKAKEEAIAAFATKFPNPNIILYGPPGTGKTHRTLELAYELIKGVPPAQYADAQKLFKDEQGKQIEFVTFHQNFTYEDFVQGIKPEVNGADQLIFRPKNGIFYEIARRAREEWVQQATPVNEPRPILFEDVFNAFLQPLVSNGKPITVPMKASGGSFEIIDYGDESIKFKRGPQGDSVSVQNSLLENLYNGTLVHSKPTGNQVYYQAIIKRLREMAQQQQTAIGPAHPQPSLLLWPDRREIGANESATLQPGEAPRTMS
jgi:hypothetical protein